MNVKSMGLYLILSICWCIFFLEGFGREIRELYLLIPVTCVLFTLCWIVLLITLKVTGCQSNRQILLLPPLPAFLAFFTMERGTFYLIPGRLPRRTFPPVFA